MPNCSAPAGFDDPLEARRLDALYDYEILDTASDARLDRLAALAAELLDVPIALISLVDEDRQWFKARVGLEDVGLEAGETPRAWAFCDETIRGDAPLVVADATADARFADNPLVTGRPYIRFYAGAPLITPSGERIGALCVIDQKPRQLSAAQRRRLSSLAATVVDLMESHRLARVLERREKRLALAELTQMAQIRYGRAFEASLNEVYLFDADSLRIVAANSGARQNLGYGSDEILRLTPLDLLDGLEPEQLERLLEPLRSGRRRSIRFVRAQRRKDGSRYPAELTLELDRGGERPLFVALVQDVTAKQAQERELGGALALTQSILDACQEAITTFVPVPDARGEVVDFRCLQANAAACRLHVEFFGDLVGVRLLQLWPAWRDSTVFEVLRRVVAQREPATIEHHYADGRADAWYKLSAAPAGEGGLTLVVSDISERKQHERALQRSNEALEQFAAGVAHDLQTPLGQIAGFAALLERHLDAAGGVPAKARETLGCIAQAAENMSHLVSGLLDYARLGTLTVDPEPVDLQEIVDHCLEEFAAELADAEVTVSPLPEVPGNATLLRQVFQNLIGNAVKYRSADPLALSIHAERSGAVLRIAVEDNGIGIEPRHAERIFEVFRRLHGTDSAYPGLGMGLALCKTIVEAHRGRIWLDVDPHAPRAGGGRSGGSRFLLELPLAAPSTPRRSGGGQVLSLHGRGRTGTA